MRSTSPVAKQPVVACIQCQHVTGPLIIKLCHIVRNSLRYKLEGSVKACLRRATKVRISAASQPEAEWCGREDSNFHGLPHSDLNAARLPIPPRPHRGRCRTVSGGAACSKRILGTQGHVAIIFPNVPDIRVLPENQKARHRTGPRKLNNQDGLSAPAESIHEIAAIAVAPKSVAPTEAVISDTSANAINSFISVVLFETLALETRQTPRLFDDPH